MKLKNKVMLITYADSMGKNLKELHTVLNTYYRDAVEAFIFCRFSIFCGSRICTNAL